MRVRWTKPQASALAILRAGKRLRFTGVTFVVEGDLAAAPVAPTTVLRLARMGVVAFVQQASPRELYVIALGRAPGAPRVAGKDAAAGAGLLSEAAS